MPPSATHRTGSPSVLGPSRLEAWRRARGRSAQLMGAWLIGPARHACPRSDAPARSAGPPPLAQSVQARRLVQASVTRCLAAT